jgi:uncharacterized protein (DUF58 family)
MLNKFKNRYKKFKHGFKSGPDWVDIPTFIDNKKTKYQSPTLMLFFWIYAFYIKILTVPGRMLLSTVLMMFFYSTIFDTPIRTFSMILAALLITDLVFGFIFRPVVKINRNLPDRVRAGTPLQVSYTVENLRKFPVINIHLDPIHQQKWLKLESDIASCDGLAPHQTLQIKAFIQSERRGEYILKPPFVSSSFPFGIFKWTCRGRYSSKILVYPKYEELNFISLPDSIRFQKEGTSMLSKIGESMEFHACREFRTGDNAKHIHWPTTARRGQLIVKEFQEEFLARTALIIDTHIPFKTKFFSLKARTEFPNLEAALSLTAAIVHKLAYSDFIVDIFAAGSEVYHFKSGRSLANFDRILDILACIEPAKKTPFSELKPAVFEEIAGIGSAIIILLNWNKERGRLIQHLKVLGVSVKVIFITEKPDLLKDIPEKSQIFSPDEIASGKVKDL